MLRHPLQPLLQPLLRPVMASGGGRTLIQRAIAVLRRFGTNAHIYLPGASVPVLGAELVVNGDFSGGATGWTGSGAGGWLISAGSAAHTAGTYGLIQSTAPSAAASKTYQVVFDCTVNAGLVKVYVGGVASADFAATGQRTLVITSGASPSYLIAVEPNTAFSGSIDNISVREITGYTSMLNGLTAANYLDSAGTTAGTVDQPVGLVLDAAGGLGVELVTNGTNLVNTAGWTSVGGGAQSATGGKLRRDPLGTSSGSYQDMTAVAGKVYKVSAGVTAISGSGAIGLYAYAGGSFATPLGSNIAIGSPSFFITASTSSVRIYLYADGTKITDFDNISVREVTGIAASQPTTANKSVLKLTNGRYNWLFDSTDLLTATYPAGYESVTVIDARSTGQVTTAGANIVGAYSMGPSVTLYGRLIVRVAVSPSDLALLQGFANRLAGL